MIALQWTKVRRGTIGKKIDSSQPSQQPPSTVESYSKAGHDTI